MKIQKRQWFTIFALILVLLLLGYMLRDLIPLLRQIIMDSKDETKMIDYIHEYGSKGVPILSGLQFLLVYIPFLPASPVQILAGLCYGIWIGSCICIVGFAAGHSLMFYAARQLGNTFAPFFDRPGMKKKEKNSFVSRLTDKMNYSARTAFLLYLIPAIPNGMLPLIFAKSKIRFTHYFFAMTFGTIPSIILCAGLGERISEGDYKSIIGITLVLIILIVLFLLFRKKILRRVHN